MNATRRAWLRELGVERIWSGGSVASAPAPESGKAPAGTAEPLHRDVAEVAGRQGGLPVAASGVANTQVGLPVTASQIASRQVGLPVTASEGASKPVALPVAASEVASKQVALPVIASEVAAQAPELAAKPAVDEEQAWTILQEEIRNCVACGLCKGRTQTVFGTGVRRARWMVIGEAPGEQEDRQGVPFVGRSGKLLDSMLAAVGRSRHEDVFIANVIKCRPPGNRDPLPEEVASCSPYLMRQITLVQPEMILVVGRFAAQTLLGTDAKIGSLRGRRHEVTVEGRKIPVVVSYHPAYLLRSPQEKTKAWQDLRLAVSVGKASAA